MEKKGQEDGVVYVGKKPAIAYVLAVITQFGEGKKEVKLKARGKAISKAVDVAEIIRKRFVQDVKIKDIVTGTEERQLEDGTKLNVSTIEIVLSK